MYIQQLYTGGSWRSHARLLRCRLPGDIEIASARALHGPSVPNGHVGAGCLRLAPHSSRRLGLASLGYSHDGWNCATARLYLAASRRGNAVRDARGASSAVDEKSWI